MHNYTKHNVKEGGRDMYLRKCFHADGTEMAEDYKIDPNSKAAQELLKIFRIIPKSREYKKEMTAEATETKNKAGIA